MTQRQPAQSGRTRQRGRLQADGDPPHRWQIHEKEEREKGRPLGPSYASTRSAVCADRPESGRPYSPHPQARWGHEVRPRRPWRPADCAQQVRGSATEQPVPHEHGGANRGEESKGPGKAATSGRSGREQPHIFGFFVRRGRNRHAREFLQEPTSPLRAARVQFVELAQRLEERGPERGRLSRSVSSAGAAPV